MTLTEIEMWMKSQTELKQEQAIKLLVPIMELDRLFAMAMENPEK